MIRTRSSPELQLTVLHGCNTIQLTDGSNTLVDPIDYAEMSAYSWRTAQRYAVRFTTRRGGGKRRNLCFRLHREILRLSLGDIPRDLFVDHINRDTLDNRRSNLRTATAEQNAINRGKRSRDGGTYSRFKGVTWCKKSRRWVAMIAKGRSNRSLGMYHSEIEAARAWNNASEMLNGEYAFLNVIPETPTKGGAV